MTTLKITSQLSQDFITSDEVVVDGGATNQVAVFRNTLKGGDVEALIIPEGGSLSGLHYVAQDPTSTSGWRVGAVLDSQGQAVQATEVLAFATTWGTVVAFVLDSAGTLRQLSFDGSSWSAPTAVSGAPTGLEGLRVAYSPGATPSGGAVALYALAQKRQLFVHHATTSAGFKATTTDLGSVFQSWVLSLTDTQGNFLLTVASGISNTAGSYSWAKDNLSNLGSIMSMIALHPVGGVPVGEMVFNATNMAGTSDRMMLMMNTVAAGNSSTGAPPTRRLSWVINPDATSLTTGSLDLPGINLQTATVVEDSEGYCNVYGLDDGQNLVAIHQTCWNKGDMSSGFDGSQTWGPALQLNQRIQGVYADPMPGLPPALMAVDADLGALHLHYMDAASKLWLTKEIRTESENTYELTRWRTKATAYDDNGVPVSGLSLKVAAASAIDVQINGAYSIIDSGTHATIVTDATGQATVSTLASTIGTPSLTFTPAGGPDHGHDPSAPINDWFAGAGSLPGQPAFTASTLQTATVNGRPLAPGLSGSDALSADQAAQLISQCSAMVASNKQSSTEVHVYSTLEDTPTHTVYADTAEAEAAENSSGTFGSRIAKAWDAVWDFAGDVWDAIKAGFVKLGQVMVDLGKGVIRLVVWIGDQLVKLADLVIQTVEQALQAVVSVFKWIGALIEDVIDFLKAIFDLGAIWRTKQVFYDSMVALPTAIKSQIGPLSTWLQDDVFGEAKAGVGGLFDQARAFFGTGTIGSLGGYQDPGAPDDTTVVAGDATANDFSNNTAANWWADQLATQPPPDLGTPSTATDDPTQAFLDALASVADDLTEAFTAFGNGFMALFDPDNPASFAQVVIGTFLDVVEDLVMALIDTLDAVIQAALAMAELAIEVLLGLFEQELDIPIISSLYKWLAGLAGYPDDRLSIGNLVALSLAFPVTVVFKLLVGDDKEPFPEGSSLSLTSVLDQLTAPSAKQARKGTSKKRSSKRATPSAKLSVSDIPWTKSDQYDWDVRSVGIVGGLLSVALAGLTFLGDLGGSWSKIYNLFGLAATGLHLLCVLLITLNPQDLDDWLKDLGGIAINLVFILLVGGYLWTVIEPGLPPGPPTAATMSVLQTIAGCCVFGLGLVMILMGRKSVCGATAAILEPIPNMLSFANYPSFKLTPLGAGLWAAKLVFDLGFGGLGGGLEALDYIL